MIRIGINGFGRIGRAIYRVNSENPKFKIVAINDINPDLKNIAYTLKYDTLYGKFKNNIGINENKNLLIDSNLDEKIQIYNKENIDEVDWKSNNVDYIIDSSGVRDNVIKSRKLIDGKIIKKVFVTYSPQEVDFTMVLGCNEDKLNIEEHDIISTSICDATAIAPVLNAINKKFNIDSGHITTLHPWLSYQNLMDGPSSSWSIPGKIYGHYELGRSVIGNLIPKPTSAIDVTFKSIENLDRNKIGSFSYRIPTSIVCSADLTLKINNKIVLEDLLSIFNEWERRQKFKIFHNNSEPLVSLDFLKSPYSAIIDHRWTDVVNQNLIKIILWYDNEWGYSSRVVDQIKFLDDKRKK